jgi:putative flippase GtrA
VVGGINTVFYYAVFALFILLNLHYVLAVALAVICGTLFNFKTHGTIVFKNKNNRLYLRYFGVGLLTFLLNTGFLKVFEIYHVKPLIAQAIIVLPMSVMSFFLIRNFVFKTVDKKQIE